MDQDYSIVGNYKTNERFSLRSSWSGLDSTTTTIGVIESMTDASGSDVLDTWVGGGTGASLANAWLGLAIDRTSTSTKEKNIFYNLNQQGDMDSMIWNLVLSIGNTSTFNVGTSSSSPYWFESTSTTYF